MRIDARPVAQLAELIGDRRLRRLTTTLGEVRRRAGRRTMWHVNSTATGGGVAEMLQALLGYVLDLGVDVRWLVIEGDEGFFDLTKRLHNQLHGSGAPSLDAADAEHYAAVSRANATALLEQIRPGDLVVLHDPQTAGLAEPLARHGAVVVWRCHIGADDANDTSEAAWRFLAPHVTAAHAHVFTRPQYRPSFLGEDTTWVIPPSIDPHAPKNVELDAATVTSALHTAGLLDGHPVPDPARFTRPDGTTGTVSRRARVVADELPDPAAPVVLQVSRWDRLKDMVGVMEAFARHVAPAGEGHLILAGPAVDDVSDDPEGAEVYADCERVWHGLPPAQRRRVMLATLPMEDVDENAIIVNALQRHATVITQKSLAEGFGLTVAEAMWKRRPVVGGRVGGIVDQIVDGSGYLVEPTDLEEFGTAVNRLLSDPPAARRMGKAARDHVHRAYFGDTHLLRWAELFGSLVGVAGGEHQATERTR
jgi:trehalose synthase